MKRAVFIVATIFSVLACSGQETKEKESKLKANEPKPKERWSVTKEIDENGNIIRLDSTYVWSFSSDGSDVSQEMLDSLMNSFKNRFKQDFSFGFDTDFFEMFPSDSIFYKSFFYDDFFMNSWKKRNEEIKKMMKRADSIHRGYLDEFRTKKKI